MKITIGLDRVLGRRGKSSPQSTLCPDPRSGAGGQPPVASRPAQVLPDPETLDLLELLRAGIYQPPMHGPIRIAGAPDGAGEVELTDAEGVPLARIALADRPEITDSGAVRWLGELSPRPFEALYDEPAEPIPPQRDSVAILIARPFTIDEIDVVATGRPVTLLVLAGPSTASPEPVLRALRSAVEVAGARPGSRVVALPLSAARAASDPVLLASVLAAHIAGPVHRLGVGSRAGRGPGAPAGRPGTVLFFTGLSGSGKSTVARAVRNALLECDAQPVTLLDGDVVRRNLSAGLGFSPADRDTNIRRIGWVAAEIARHGGLAICSPIAPHDLTRRAVRDLVHDAGARFVLVHVATPVQECERRDRKGLYAKARAGEIADFTGVSAPYEVPGNADLVIDTTSISVEQARDVVLELLANPQETNPQETQHSPLIEESRRA